MKYHLSELIQAVLAGSSPFDWKSPGVSNPCPWMTYRQEQLHKGEHIARRYETYHLLTLSIEAEVRETATAGQSGR